MKVNENTIYIFLLGILAGIICMQCVNHFRKSPKDVYVDNFEYEKESLGILKREELKNEHYECLDQIAYWGTDSLDSFSLSNLCNDKKLFFCFSVRKASVLELHELNTTNTVNNMIPNNFFIALSYMILSIQFTILIHKSYERNKILVASIR